jgi:hypothetical protein
LQEDKKRINHNKELLMTIRVIVKEPWTVLKIGPELFQIYRPVSIQDFKRDRQ